MTHGRRVQGDAAYKAAVEKTVETKARGGLGWRVTGQGKPDAIGAPIGSTAPAAAAPKAGIVTQPAEPPAEAYNVVNAILKAKENPFDLPRLLDLELARPDLPRKTVLVAYLNQVEKMETTEDNLALLARIDAALEPWKPKTAPEGGTAGDPPEEQPKGGDDEPSDPTAE